MTLARFILLASLAGACAPDREVPEATSSTSSDEGARTDRNSGEQQPTPGPGGYLGWGANVGSADVLKRLADCNIAGFFFDRALKNGYGDCDRVQRVPFRCIDFSGTVSQTRMTTANQDQLKAALSGELAGYQFDQCVEEQFRFVIYLVKKEASGTLVVNKVFVAKP